MNLDPAMFPSRPEYAGRIAPIYLEPMPGSGERITVAILAQGEDRQLRIHPALHSEAMNCLYGNKAANLQGLIELCAASLREHLGKTNNLSDWIPPIATATLGRVRAAYAQSMTDLIAQGLRAHASLGVLPHEAEEIDSDSALERRNWDEDIRHVANPIIQPYFGKRIQLTAASERKTAIGFLHERYAANFALLSPGANLGNAMNAAKAKLWNLNMLRSAPVIKMRGSIELIVGHAAPDFDPSLSKKAHGVLTDAVAELREEAHRCDLGLSIVHNHTMAAEHIYKQAA